MNQLYWLRTDLRTIDNTALSAAMNAGPTIALYLITPGQWIQHDEAACKIDFWLRNLVEVSARLAHLNVPLLVHSVETWRAVPGVIANLCRTHEIETVHANEEYGVNERRRDDAVADALEETPATLRLHLDQLLFAPGTVTTLSGGYFKVFSQFRKLCYLRLNQSLPACLPAPDPQAPLRILSDAVPDAVHGFAHPTAYLRELWPAGETVARKRLTSFADEAIADYQSRRDFPAEPGTSQLSAYLTAGILSPRQCLHAALAANRGELDSGNQGAVTWINELLWREFYKHVLVGYPRVSMGRAFRRETETLPWRHAPDELAAWQQGRTGFPIIDAAMRQLQATGWMHNRLRMIVAMFLSKNLLIHWREGERWFMQHLIDGDLASNNGGWQWSASTGTDSVPYFRLFNPISQSSRFDPQGDFIRRWLPELADMGKRDIHNPTKLNDLFAVVDYPLPIIDLPMSRDRALTAFRNLGEVQ